jgi:hypothetical protein
MRRFGWFGTVALMGAIAVIGCQAASGGKGAVRVKTELAPNIDSYNVSKIAVLGLANTTGNPDADKMADYITQALGGTEKYYFADRETFARDAEQFRVAQDYDRLLSSWQKVRKLDPKELSAVLEATGYDALVGIEVNKWEEVKLSPNQEGTSDTSVGARVEMYAPDGTLLWSASDLKTEKSQPYNPEYNIRATTQNQARTTSAKAVPDPPPIEKVAVAVSTEIADTLPLIKRAPSSGMDDDRRDDGGR